MTRAKPGVVDNMLSLRDRRAGDLETYNSKIFPKEFSPFHSPASQQNIAGKNPSEVVVKPQSSSAKEWGDLVFVDNVMQLQSHSIFFKTLLGFWPEEKKPTDGSSVDIRKSIARDTHAASAVLSGFLDGLAVNGVSYHPVEGRDEISSVRYFLLYAGPSRNQLARLVRRLHTCGDSRVLLSDKFMELKHASMKLTNLDSQLVKRIKDDEIDLAFLSERRTDLGKIKFGVPGGIQNRILQNEIYWDTLQKGIDDLREVRIRGWQTYSEFVRRNYEPQINSFSRTQDRLNSVDDRLGNARHIIDTRIARNISSTIMFGVLIGSALLTANLLSVGSGGDQAPQICLWGRCVKEPVIPFAKNALLSLSYFLVISVVIISIIRIWTNYLLRDLIKQSKRILKKFLKLFTSE